MILDSLTCLTMVSLPSWLADADAVDAGAVTPTVGHLAVRVGNVTLPTLPPDLAVAQTSAVRPVVGAQHWTHA